MFHTLDASSELLAQLCREENGKCRFPSLVELDENIKCYDLECSLDIVQVVEVYGIFYEFIKPACISFPFFNKGKRILKRIEDGSETLSGCADENFKSGTPYYLNHYIFTNDKCDVAVIVELDGTVAIDRDNISNYASLTYFQVQWEKGEYPHQSNNYCGYELCNIVEGRCRCRVIGVENKAKFTSLPSRNDVLLQLTIGAVPSDMMDYHSMITTGDGMKVHFKTQRDLYDIDTAFEVFDEFGRRRLLKNMESIVQIDTSKTYMFRNPPVFHNAIRELR